MVCVWLAHIRVRAGSVGGFCALSRRTGGGGREGRRSGGAEGCLHCKLSGTSSLSCRWEQQLGKGVQWERPVGREAVRVERWTCRTRGYCTCGWWARSAKHRRGCGRVTGSLPPVYPVVGVLDRIPGMGWRGGDLSARPMCASPGPECLYGTVVSGWGDVGAAVREWLGVGTPPRATDVLYHAARRASYTSSHHGPRDLLAVYDLALHEREGEGPISLVGCGEEGGHVCWLIGLLS